MSLGQLAVAHKHRERDIFKLIAFMGRYGKQPLESLRWLTMREISQMAEAVHTLMQEEKQAHEKAAETSRRRR